MSCGSKTKLVRVHPDFVAVHEARLRPRGISYSGLTFHLARVLRQVSEKDLSALVSATPRGVRRVRGRRGMMDTATIPVLLLVASVLLVVFCMVAMMGQSIFEELGTNGDLDQPTASRLADYMGQVPALIRLIFVIGLFGIAGSMIGLSFFTPSHPIFGFIVVAVAILGVYMGYVISGVWESMEADADGVLLQALDSQPELSLIMTHLHQFFMGIAALCGFAFWGGLKRSSGGGAGGAFG